jgi:predicted nucleotidyltransferase
MNEIARESGSSKAKRALLRLDDALRTLRAHRAELERIGVVHAGVFGSVARGEAGPESDLDALVVLDDSKVVSVYDAAAPDWLSAASSAERLT